MDMEARIEFSAIAFDLCLGQSLSLYIDDLYANIWLLCVSKKIFNSIAVSRKITLEPLLLPCLFGSSDFHIPFRWLAASHILLCELFKFGT